MASATTSVKAMIISDTHGVSQLPKQDQLPKVDILLHCGDLTRRGQLSDYENTLLLLGNIDAELKLVVADNHDTTLDGDYWRARGRDIEGEEYDSSKASAAMRLMKGRKAMQAGVTFLHEGVHTFTLQSGATFTLFRFAILPGVWNQDRFNPADKATKYNESIAINPIPDFGFVDIVMTHTPPLGVLDQVKNGGYLGCRSLQRAIARAKPRLHCFGHIHEGYGAERVTWSGILPDWDEDQSVLSRKAANGPYLDVTDAGHDPLQYGSETLLVNAAIMDEENQPINAPWIVDMELPLSK